MPKIDSVYQKAPGIISRKAGNEYILVPVTDNIADMNSVYTLNETGAYLWEHIDGKRSIGDLIKALMNDFETDERSAAGDVLTFIEDLRKYLIIAE
jgi:hypothetical protein